jgi:hypothetical protein
LLLAPMTRAASPSSHYRKPSWITCAGARSPACGRATSPTAGSKAEARIFAGRGVRAGAPDLLIVAYGKPQFLEVKTPSGRVTPEQHTCHEALSAVDACVAVVRTGAVARLEAWQVIRPNVSTQYVNAFSELRHNVARRAARDRRHMKIGELAMNKLIKVDDGLIEKLHDEVEELEGNGIGKLLKFDIKTRKYFIGDNEVPLGREYIAHCDQFARGWTKFVNKEKVDQKVVKVSEGKPPTRKELDDLDLVDTENDSWVYHRYLPLEDIETGEIVIFVSKSRGGRIALTELLKTYAHTWERGLPTVKLATDTFPSPAYGPIPRPNFVITKRDGSA